MTGPLLSARSLALLLGNWQSEAPAYRALADRVRLMVLDGRILVGTRLPAERELAARLQLSRSTIAAAYRELREAGVVSSIRGSGSVTRLPSPAAQQGFGGGGQARRPVGGAEPHSERGVAHRAAAWPGGESADRRWSSRQGEPSTMLNFTQAALPASAGVAEAMQDAAAQIGPLLGTLGYEAHGLPALREAIADRYTERGLPTHADQVMVTSGSLSALALLTRALLTRGDRAIVETPTYPHAADTLIAAGARLVPVPVSADDGWNEDAFVDALAETRPVLAFVMPDFHNPTGASMSAGFRRRLVEAAGATATVLVADETTAELDIDRGEGEYMPLAAYGDAIMLGSASKTFWGGLRIGWLRAEPTMIRRLLAVRASIDIGTPPFEQLVTTSLVRRTAELLPLRRLQLAEGRTTLYSALRHSLPEWELPQFTGGLCAWVGLGRPVSSQLVLSARAHGVLFTAGPRFGIDGAFERFLRLPINYSPAETRRAVDALQSAWSELEGRAPGAELPSFADLI